MASSGSITTASTEGRSLKFSWTEKSQSVANNSTTIEWKLVGAGSASGYVKCGGFYVKINGSVKVDKSTDYRKEVYNGTVVASGTATIEHKSDGTKSFDVVINAGIYAYARNSKKEGTFTLDTIARSSTITSASNVTLGNTCNVKWTPNSSSFYFKLKFKLGDWSKTVSVGKIGNTNEYTYTGYTIPTSVSSYITDGVSDKMTVYLYTYSNSSYDTQIGSTASKTFTVTVPSTTVPNITSFSVEPVNENSIVKDWGIFLKNHTKAKINCSAEGISGSTISNYVISGGYSVTVKSMPYTGSVITKSGNITFECKAVDSRGRSSQLTESSITVIDYSNPSISDLIVTRDSGDATKVKAKVTYKYSSVDGKNNASAVLYYRKSSDTVYEEYGIISNGTEEALTISFDDTASYVFQVIVTDSLGNTDKYEAVISTMKVIMDFRDGGKGLGIGKIAESDQLEVGFNADFFENTTFEKNVDIVGNLNASNLGRTVYSGMDKIIEKSKLSSSENSFAYFYILKPFNLVYVRFRFDGLASAISATTNYTTLCTFDDRFKPSGATPLTVSGGNGCDVLVNNSGELRVVPRNGLSKDQNMYISGIYSLNSNSSLYI